jgi:archaellum component FlaC
MMLIKEMSSIMLSISNISSENITSVGDAISNTLKGISTSVDMSKLQAVTNMFNAFNGINKSESIINKFTESVKEFTETCKDLMDAMGNNTNAINNMGTSGSKRSGSIFDNIKERVSNFIGGDSNDNTTIQTNSVRIANVDELAKTIADKINGALSVDVADTQIQLLINGTGGNEWTITKY